METASGPKPTVITWFKVYAIVMAIIYLMVLLAGIGLFAFPNLAPEEFATGSPDEKIMVYIYGVVFVVLGAALFVAYLFGVILKPKPWVWIFNMVLICIGLSGCPTLFASIPLLIFWLKPETKAYYGRPVPALGNRTGP